MDDTDPSKEEQEYVDAIVDELARLSNPIKTSREIAQVGTCAATRPPRSGR